jgi:hypothetical protein
MRRRAGASTALAGRDAALLLGFVRGRRPFTGVETIPMIVERLVNTKS